MNDIKVSICCQTYNHVNYIEECLNGFLMQKTNFKFEILLRDDASSDGTTEIVKKYSDKYPDIINTLIYTENQFKKGVRPFRDNVIRAKGKYIAICEGDDYWTDPYKLQKQVDFLEKNNDFSICFTDYMVYDENIEKFNYPELSNLYKNKSVFSRNQLIFSNFIPNATVMFKSRKEVFSKLDPNLFPGDWFLHILNSEFGKIKFLPFESAVYRKHGGGVCSASKPIDNYMKYIKSIKLFLKVYDENYSVRLLFNLMIIKFHLQRFKLKIKG